MVSTKYGLRMCNVWLQCLHCNKVWQEWVEAYETNLRVDEHKTWNPENTVYDVEPVFPTKTPEGFVVPSAEVLESWTKKPLDNVNDG